MIIEPLLQFSEYLSSFGQRRVTVADCDHPSIDIEQAVLNDICPKIKWLACKTEDEVINQCRDAEGILIQYAPITRRVLEQLPNCKIIACYGDSVDTIDIFAATELGIVVSNLPNNGINEVSNHALTMMLCLTRRITYASDLVKNGLWNFQLIQPILQNQIQTIGIIGIGRIGSAMALKTHALGMKVIAYDPYMEPEELPNYIDLVTLDVLLQQSDVVSVHCPLTEITHNLLNEDKLRLMKPSAYLINTACGSIIDEIALDKMLSENKLAGVGMDTFAIGPSTHHPQLFRHDNFLCTPQIAWDSKESIIELKRNVAEEIRRVLCGDAPKHQINKF